MLLFTDKTHLKKTTIYFEWHVCVSFFEGSCTCSWRSSRFLSGIVFWETWARDSSTLSMWEDKSWKHGANPPFDSKSDPVAYLHQKMLETCVIYCDMSSLWYIYMQYIASHDCIYIYMFIQLPVIWRSNVKSSNEPSADALRMGITWFPFDVDLLECMYIYIYTHIHVNISIVFTHILAWPFL